MDEDEKNFKILEITADVRKLEIGLFWSRSLFFWGFSAVAITAYGAAYQFSPPRPEVQFSVACAGFVCSVIWSLVNRSSKYWQKIWEEKAADASNAAIGHNIFLEPVRQKGTIRDFPWWRAHFSVSKLATAFSDFTALVWLILALNGISTSCLIVLVGICTSIYLVYVFLCCGPDPRP